MIHPVRVYCDACDPGDPHPKRCPACDVLSAEWQALHPPRVAVSVGLPRPEQD